MRWVGLVLGLGLLGCTSTESRCETLCEFTNKCSDDGTKLDCSESAIDECVDDYDDLSDDCQDAFDDFADCVDDEDQNCSSVQNQCLGEAAEVLEKCGD